ncbi:hypothetical protein NIES2100_11440 [Calothrix sp. NIES-2100]|uniref:DUF433 domain-containing protein n=1 Tax=Calothrix sp. NIES-2100 TaxID=1954172 RepID=UPI000B611070|nr:hypothetical protein NIES2100_11440 [Calothrix sp. NIES-2100]
MTSAANRQTSIIRAERGLTIPGTRITLSDVMDYVTEQYPPKFIQGLFDLSEEQINAALAYIKGTPKNKLCQIVGAGLPRPYELRVW